MGRILCVAEKPSIAKAVAQHLGGAVRGENIRGNVYVKNYNFDYNFPRWGHSAVTFTSVLGHIKGLDFDSGYKSWSSCNPVALFEAPIINGVEKDKKAVADNIKNQARHCQILFIWTDCDREGEHIGTEIREIAQEGNPRIEVHRARFSNIERAHIINAANHPIALDECAANAVAARQELDLRIGAAFTRMQTLELKPLVDRKQEVKVISYGSCQFPTLGFVVDRYFRVQNFIPEPFWSIKISHTKDKIPVRFTWSRGHLFDRLAVLIIYERLLASQQPAQITRVLKKPTSKWKPLPLTTVELQKLGSRFLRMDSQSVMTIAETLYQKGFISYPRTETDQFDPGMNLRALVERQTPDPAWGPFAQSLLNGAFQSPRNGRNNDKAHPPIHPVTYAAPGAALSAAERKVYEFVVRRFLAACAADATGASTTVTLTWPPPSSPATHETFTATGLTVLTRGYLDVYPYESWTSSTPLPAFVEGERFPPAEATMEHGATRAPGYLTEPELIALMDRNGIGTDATMAEHIAKIKERNYVVTRSRGGGGGADAAPVAARGGRGSTRARGRGRGRGGSTATTRPDGTSSGVQEFIPTTLGVALVAGYDAVVGVSGVGLSKPFLRKEMEVQMKAICEGRVTRAEVVGRSLEQYRAVFVRSARGVGELRRAVRRFVLGEGEGEGGG